MIDIKKGLKSAAQHFKDKTHTTLYTIIVVNLLIIVFQFIYLGLRFDYLNDLVPLWYTRAWGDYQMAPKLYTFVIPAVSSGVLIFGLIIYFLLSRHFLRYLLEVLSFFITFSNIVLTFSMIRIILSASVPFEPIFNPLYFSLVPPFVLSFLLTYTLIPQFMEFARSKDLITNPKVHNHPAMILQKPSVRGGGVVYTLVFLLLSILFFGFRFNLLGFYLALGLVGLLGIADDYQNTHPRTAFKLLEKPAMRLLLLFMAVSLLVISGVRIDVINNPINGVIDLNKLVISIGLGRIPLVSTFVTLVWLVWILNLLSWSNGIDGQYGGIIGIASLIVAVLSLRFVPLEPIYRQVAVMAAISAGAAFAFTKYTWYPSKLMWGFGAMSAGLVLATLSILIKGKIVVSVLIILVPFLDAVVTVIRRILQKKNPLVGDRGHLHHLLLDRGWSIPRIALFYWVTTAVFGLVGIWSSERYLVQVGLSLVGLVGFFIVLLNLKSIKEQRS